MTDHEHVTYTKSPTLPQIHTDNSSLTIKCKQKCLFSFGQFCKLALPGGKKQMFGMSEEKYKVTNIGRKNFIKNQKTLGKDFIKINIKSLAITQS